MVKKKHHRYEGPPPCFGGNIAAAKVLASIRPPLDAGRVQVYRGFPSTWWAPTARGPRWVTKTAAGWKVAKTPPGTEAPPAAGSVAP